MMDTIAKAKKVMHKLVGYDDPGDVIFEEYTYDEHCDAMFSDGSSKHWLLIVDGKTYYDHGIVRKKKHMAVRCWPLVSSAAGIHEDEVEDQMRIDKENGVPTEYIDGDPVLTSKSHRRKYLQSRGIFDRNAGFGDPTPVNM